MLVENGAVTVIVAVGVVDVVDVVVVVDDDDDDVSTPLVDENAEVNPEITPSPLPPAALATPPPPLGAAEEPKELHAEPIDEPNHELEAEEARRGATGGDV